MIEELKELQLEIARIEDKNQGLHLESRKIYFYLKNFEWEQLTAEEKQNKRKKSLRGAKRYFEEEGPETLYYENAIIKLYDIGLLLLEEIKNIKTDSILLKRLKVLLFFEMKEIDANYSLYKKKFIPLYVYEGLFKEFEDSNLKLENLNLFMSTLKILHQYKKDEGDTSV